MNVYIVMNWSLLVFFVLTLKSTVSYSTSLIIPPILDIKSSARIAGSAWFLLTSVWLSYCFKRLLMHKKYPYHFKFLTPLLLENPTLFQFKRQILILCCNFTEPSIRQWHTTCHLSVVKSDKNDSECLFLVNFLTLVVSSSLQLSVLRQYTESTLHQVERRTHNTKCVEM